MQAPDPVEQLTEPQRECLRLVLAHYSSKEIAQKLGVGPSAVDKRIERAVQLLGASSRFEAARRLAAYEDATGATASDPIASDPIASDPMDVAPPAGGGDDAAWTVHRDTLFDLPASSAPPGPRVGWSWRRRLAAIVLLAFALAAAMLVLLGVAEELADILGRYPGVRRSFESDG